EDPHAHLKSFIEICNTFVIPNISADDIRLTLFPFSLRDEARQWAYSLEPGEITTWNQMIEKFMKKYFPLTENARRRRDIANFQQKDRETVSNAWARFKRLVRNCPHNGFPKCVQIEIFYDSLNKVS
uniref:retrotransposon gag family protein n=1 Tax=Picosynechococcus sp. (strain ATCC 27264 / PCC 7002 / PR-6) TaxID=32049 RepID=UPI001C3D1ED9